MEGESVLLSTLFLPGAASKMAEFCEKLSRREAMFKKLNVGTASLAVLSGNFVVLNAARKADSAALPSACKNLLQFLLSALPQSGESYLPVFRFIHSFCSGEAFGLTAADTAFLLEQVRSSHVEEEEEEEQKEEGGSVVKDTDPQSIWTPLGAVAVKTGEETVGETRERGKSEPRSDARSEVQKLFTKFQAGRHEARKSKTKAIDGGEKPSSGSASMTEQFTQTNTSLLKELGAGKQLLDFCTSLPVLATPPESYFSLPEESPDAGHQLAAIVGRLHGAKCAVEAVSLLADLPSLLDPLSPARLTSLVTLLTACLKIAIAATVKLASMKGTAKSLATPEAARKVYQDVKKGCSSVSELFGQLSCCAPPSATTLATVRNLVCEIVTISLKLIARLTDVMRQSPRVGAHVVQNVRTLTVYYTLSGLLPLLGIEGTEEGKILGHAKFSVPLVELVFSAMQTSQGLFEELGAEASDESPSEELPLTVSEFDVLEGHSGWQCGELLLTHLPLLRTLFSLLLHTYKKALTLASSPAMMQTQGAAATKDASSAPIKTRTEKQERLAKLLQLSLSEKISEKLAAVGAEGVGEGEEGSDRSPSPSSTVSSSGEVEGVYTLYTDEGSQSSDESEDEAAGEEDSRDVPVILPPEHHLPPFMAALFLRETPEMPAPPIPPPPPPIPPRRKISEPLLRMTSPDLPPRHIPRKQAPELHYSDLKKKPGFYLKLATATLRCLSSGLVHSDNPRVQRFLCENLQPEHVSCLAWLVQSVDSTLSSGNNKEVKSKVVANLGEDLHPFARELMEMVHEMIMSGAINHERLHQVLLHELGLGLSPKRWPLHVSLNSLALLGRVLVCRLQHWGSEGEPQADDPLAVSIWKGFLSTLEEKACSEGDQEQDLDVVHLQLLLFVWQSLSVETRRDLLTRCALATMKAAQARESGVGVSPLVVSRLLLVLDYLLFQFREPAQQLTEQVNHNLSSSMLGGPRPLPPHEPMTPLGLPLPPVPPHVIKFYPCEQQLQYCTVLSKPGGGKEDRIEGEGLTPRFYNVRPHPTSKEGEKSEFEMGQGIDEEACKTVLKLPSVSGVGKGYDELCHALVVLMGCGVDYQHQTSKLPERVLTACASHQCFCLSTTLLSCLPPSFNILSATVDGKGLSCKDPIGASLLIHVLYLGVRLKTHSIDTEDILDTMVESGYSQEEAEEVIARVISVVDLPEHLLLQTVTVLEELCSLDEDIMLPLVCVIALDFLFCLVTRLVLDETTHHHEEDEEETAANDEKSAQESFFEKHARLVPVLIKAALKLVSYGHLYALMAPSHPVVAAPLSKIPQAVLMSMLKLSGRNPVQAKDSRILFQAHIPKERLKLWSFALLIDPAHKEKLCTRSVEEMHIDKCMFTFLDLQFTAFSGTRTFDPARNLKSTLSSLVTLLLNLFVLKPSESAAMVPSLVPLACDSMMEFVHDDLEKLIRLSDEKAFLIECTKYKVSECFKLVRLPGMQGCSLLGPALADFFALLGSMLDNQNEWPVLALLDASDPSTSVIELALLAASPSTSGSAVAESLKFLSKILQQSEKSPTDPHLLPLSQQIASIAQLSPSQLQAWLRRLVLGSPADGPSEVAANTTLLRKFAELLTREECTIDATVGCTLLAMLLPLGSELVEVVTSQQKLLPSFKDLFETLVMLAGTNKDNGHLVLAKAVEKWLPDCVNLLREKEADLQEKGEAVAPAGALLQYVSHLTSAVQFVTNMVRCTDKRGLAGETDSPVLECESEDEEEGGAAVATAEEEDSQGEESDEDPLDSKLCTFTVTQREFMNQHWYHCHTCKLVDGSGVCTVCAKVCHKGHDLTYSKFGSFFCDCGAKEDGNCKALVKRLRSDGEGSPVSPQERTPFFDPRRKRKRRGRRQGEGEKGRDRRTKKAFSDFSRRSSFPSLPVLKIVHQIEKYKTELREYLDCSGLASCTLELLHRVIPPVVLAVDRATSSGCNLARQAMIDLHENDKEIEYTDNLMAATLGSQEGAFENVRLNFTGDQGQVMRQLLSSNAIRRVAMCALSSVKGKRQHLAVNHDKGKITILQLFPILKQADSNRRKLTLTRLSSATVPFTVLSMSHNPCHEDFMIVCGLKECQLLVLNSSGQVTNRAMLHPSVEGDGYIVKSLWVPGSQTEMVIVTDTFVKVYDLKVDLLCPTYYFIVLTGKIKDATVAVTGQGKFLVVITSTGAMYSQPIIPACSAVEGPVYFNIDIAVKHPSIQETDEQVCGGGASVYYSHALQMLFFSYYNGKSFVATVNKAVTETLHVFEVPLKSNSAPSGGKGPGPALIQWTEVQHHPGLVCALSQTTSNPVVLLVKPEQIQVHELKALPNKAKVQGMVAMRQPPSPGEPNSQHRTTLIILCEDGSLRIYVANNNTNTEFWLQPQFQPTSPLAILRSGTKRRALGTRKIDPKFPVDFFEHCQQLQYNDLEFSGNDILHVYNKQQVKHRLSSGGLYIANTKAGGFSMVVSNQTQHNTTVMVGVRVLLGCRSLERAPSYIEVFGRTHPVSFPAAACRWVDIPFTREESLQADKSIRINFGPSLDPSGVSLVDSIRVYGKSKDVFGWPEHPPDPLPPSKPSLSTQSSQVVEEESSALLPPTSSKPLSPLERLLCNAFCILGNHFLSVDQEKWPDMSDIVSKATTLLMYSVPFSLQYHFKFLMGCMAEGRESYHQSKDRTQLSHIVRSLAAHQSQEHNPMEPEYFQYLLLMLLTISRSRPENLQLVAPLMVEHVERERREKKAREAKEKEVESKPEKEAASGEETEAGTEQTEGEEKKEERKEEEEGDVVGGKEGEGQKESEEAIVLEAPALKEDEGVNDGSSQTELVNAFIDLLNDIFWGLFVRRPSSTITSPVVHPGFAAIDITVSVMTEVMWAFVVQDHTLVDSVLRYTIRFFLAPDSHICESSLHVVMRMLKQRKPKKEKAVEEAKEAAPGGETEETDHEAPPPSEPPVEGERVPEEEPLAEAEGGEEGEEEGMEGEQQLEGAWQQQHHLGQPPMVDLEEALANPELLEQMLANPEQYLMAMQGLMPDEDAMMNLAIALSLQEEAGGGGVEAAQALQAALQGLGLPLPAGMGGGGEQGEGGGGGGESEDQVVPSMRGDQEVPQSSHGHDGAANSSHRRRGEEDEDRSSSSSRSSLFSPGPEEALVSQQGEGVLRESTATPSDPSGSQGDQGRGGGGGGGSATENQQDVSSEPEMVNDSSGEDEPGEDDGTIVESLSQRLDTSSLDQPERDGGDVLAGRLAVLRKKLLSSLLEHLYIVEVAGGMRSIIYMQLVLFVAANLECTREDCEVLVNMLKTFIKQLDMSREDVGEVVERSRKREVHLLYLRFFNILMSRKKLRDEDSSSYASHMLWFATARTLLKDSQCMDFCRRTLKAIMGQKQCLEVVEEPPPLTPSILRPQFTHPLTDMSPFFQKQYVKGHSGDIFTAYGRLLAEIVLVLPCQLKKMSEVTKHLPSPEFGPEWIQTLCDYLLQVAQTTGVGRRHVRKLLLHICGSKEKYRLTRDVHALKTYMQIVRNICLGGGFDPEQPTGLPIHLPYKAMLTLIEQLKAIDEVASTRTTNWQAFCLEEKATLSYLLQSSFVLDEGLAPLVLQLIHTALSGVPPKSEEGGKKEEGKGKGEKEGRGGKESKEGKEGKEGKEEKKEESKETKAASSIVPDKESCEALVRLFLSFLDDESLLRFVRLFLLQSNSTPLRWQAHGLLHCLYRYSQPAEQVQLVEMLWKLWPEMPNYGHKASQFVDLLGYCTISTPQGLEKEALCQSYVERAIALLKHQNELVAHHSNSHVYSQLLSLVDFDGYYLESEPCLVCNDPEIPYSTLKLYSIKSEVRYSPTMILVKLVGSYTFSQVLLRISDLKRTKMVRTVNLYYSNRTVQNVIELKNKRSLWLKARTVSLTPGQTEVKIDLPLPIVASNVIIEFADFYDNLQGGSEMLQCPRCQASVPAHPGVCGTCGENVYQCHKCRAINYDEKDPFLCNSCGFSKYAKFEIMVEARPCSAVDPIESEEDRQKTLSRINTLLERADQVYKLLVQHRNSLDELLISLASGTLPAGTRVMVMAGESVVNRGILSVAHRYCVDCKTTYQELSKIVQSVLASRRELVKYDQKKMELGGPPVTPSEPSTPAVTTPTSAQLKLLSLPSLPLATGLAPQCGGGRCFGCASAAMEHCITLLRALAFQPQTRRLLMQQNLIRELVDFNLRSGGPRMQRNIRKLLCHLTRDDPVATAELNEFVLARVLEQISPQRTNPSLASAVRPEMLLLSASLDMEDSCWEQRLRTVMRLFRKAQSHPSPAVMAGVTMPCLKILQALIYPKDPTSAKNKKRSLAEVSSVPVRGEEITARASQWLTGDPSTSFQRWREAAMERGPDLKSMSKEELRQYQLMEKYAKIWRERTKKVAQFRSNLRQASWLRSMLFNPSSQSARKATCDMLSSLCGGEARQRQILDLLYSFLDEVGSVGEHSQEFLELLRTLTEEPTGKWKSYLAMRGVLPRIGSLIAKEIDHLLELEETTLTSDLSQGYALKMLTSFLQSFLKVEQIKRLFKGQLVGMVLNGYLSLKRLVVQRTKRIDETQELLLDMLEDLTSGTERERQEFMAVCVETLNKFRRSDMITPIFVFERLCNIIHPEENDVGDFYLSLEKDPQQEEFLQGRMQGNPYPSSTAGLGPLMRDVKNKICTDCELISLLEDDTGMELLVCNKIISLDLPMKDVYKKIWCAQPNHGECMRVVYRMRGLLGDATEDIVERLESGRDKDEDEEEAYKMATVLSKCGGLDSILSRLAHVKDFIQGHHLISAALKLLGYCVKIKVNRQYLVQTHLNTLNILLGILHLALYYEEQEGNGIGAAVVERVLQVTERILHEASSAQPVLVRSISQEGGLVTVEGGTELKTLLKHIESPFVQSNPTVREGLMHIIPFLTFGDPRNMTVLLQHFAPYLNFEKFDGERSSENRLYLDCFCVIASGIGSDPSGEKLKDLAIEMGLTPSAVTYLKQRVPQKIGTFDTPEWKECISQPSLPYVLKMLAGLCRCHSKTQLALIEVIPELHLLEQVASEAHIGTMAENLLEAMMDHPTCREKIKESRKATREEKKRKAMAMREKELGALGMQVNEKGQVKVQSSLLHKMGTELEEESGLKCCICLEGYRNQPQKALGVYTYTRKVTLDEFENKPRRTVGYATVSHFNVVHYDCHSAAIKLARSRDEWESAALQNANTKCNGLMPIWGTEVTDSVFSSCLARHNNYMQECTGLYDPSFRSLVHDLRLLLLRFAYEKSFSAESGGGGPQSNMFLIPYLIHIGIYVLNTTRDYQREERSVSGFLTAAQDKWISSAYELDGPVYAVVLSLFIHNLSQWEEHRVTFLRRLLLLAHARNASSSPIKSLPSPEPAEYAVYRPVLVLYGLVDSLQHMLKKTVSVAGEELGQNVLDYIRNNDVAILEGCDKLLVKYQEELLPAESFEEFCDVVGLLGVIEDPTVFLTELIASVAQ